MKRLTGWRWAGLPLQLALAATVWAQGVPMDQWTAQEQAVIEMASKQYAAQGMALTQQQAEMTIQSMRDQMARMMGMAAGLQAAGQIRMPSMPAQQMPAQAATAPLPAISEQQLAQTISKWPAKPALFEVSGRADGFDINGEPVLDPEGRIFSYAVNTVTGAATYAREDQAGVKIKAVGVQRPYPTAVIASGVRTAQGWEFHTATGQRLVGSTLSVLSDGFMLGRGSAAFRYQTGIGYSSIAIPNGYTLAPLQRGDIGSTGYVLLEKEGAVPASDDNPVMGLWSAAKAIGSTVGLMRKEDYALMDTRSGRLFPINVPADGKTVALMSECKRRNWVISECQKMQTFESVYGVDGFKNNSHYYWKVQWLPTAQGAIALTQEEGVSAVYATNLQTGQKVPLFQRSLGIGDWDVVQHADGRIGVKARMVLDWQEIPDVLEFMRLAATTPQPAESSTGQLLGQ